MDLNNMDNDYKKRLNKILNRILIKSRQFCDKYCDTIGLSDILVNLKMNGNITHEVLYSDALSDDFDYFIFTKSTKTLHAIKKLISDKEYHFNEDALILVRSIFEGYLASRYFDDTILNVGKKEEVIKEFIKSPIGLISDCYYKSYNIVKDRKNNNKITQVNGPSKYKEGDDNAYYYNFYPFLCQFSHNSFGTLKFFSDGACFYYDKENYVLETLLFTIFVFTKLLESIVTVSGENFDTFNEEKSYYNLVYDSLELQKKVFDFLIIKYNTNSVDKLDFIIQFYLFDENQNANNKKMIDMLEKMKSSLNEEVGSLKKDKIDEKGNFIRKYPICT